jgi:hypothetical protein
VFVPGILDHGLDLDLFYQWALTRLNLVEIGRLIQVFSCEILLVELFPVYFHQFHYNVISVSFRNLFVGLQAVDPV